MRVRERDRGEGEVVRGGPTASQSFDTAMGNQSDFPSHFAEANLKHFCAHNSLKPEQAAGS